VTAATLTRQAVPGQRFRTVDPVVAQVPRLSTKQIDSIRQSRAPLNVWTGAIRSGKTVASLLRWMMYIRTAPTGGRLVMVGKTKDTINRNVFSVLKDERIFGALAKEVHYTPGANLAVILGRQVDIIGAHNVDSEERLRGLTCVGAYVDEATLLPENFWVQLLGRLSVDGAKLFATTNPDNPAHYLRRDYLLRADNPAMGLRHWHFTIDDNPALSAAKKAAYKAQFTGLFFKRFILGQWVAAEGAVFDMWDEESHVIPRQRLPMIDRWISAGVDYGTTNPFAGLMVGLGVDNKLYVTDEYRYDSRQHHRQKTDRQYAEALRGWLGNIEVPHAAVVDTLTGERIDRRGVEPEFVCVDPSAASFIRELVDEGTLLPTKARNAVLDGIRTVSSLLALHRLYVVDTCKALINEFPGYAWDDKKAKEGHDVPIKLDDHSLDALRYAVHTTEGAWRPHVMYDLAA
jgi:PBSX family phage terminase large subunit